MSPTWPIAGGRQLIAVPLSTEIGWPSAISYLPSASRVAIIYLGRRLPAASSSLPGGPGRRATSRRLAPSLLLGLAPGGVCTADSITGAAGGLLHHRFTLTGRSQQSAFCCTVPSGHPAWVLPSTVLCGARTFLRWRCAIRDRLACLDTYNQYNTNGSQCQPAWQSETRFLALHKPMVLASGACR